MTQSVRRLIGAMLAAMWLPGCALFGPAQPPTSPPVKKDPFKEDEIARTYSVPPIQTKQFPPPEFPLASYDRSQKLAVADLEPLTPLKQDPRPAKIAPPEIIIKREPLTEALQCMLDNKHDEALRHLQAYDADTQELFQRLLPTMSILSKKKLSDLSAAEIAVLHEQLYSLVGTLRARTTLEIGKVCFCEWVKDYGNYKPLPEGHAFAAASQNRPGELVQLYVELRNFVSELRHGAYETRLSSSVEISDGRGELVWSYHFTEEEKNPIRRRTQLHDWFNNYTFHVPKGMPPGLYRLTIQVADETLPESRRLARQTVDFRVAPPILRAALH